MAMAKQVNEMESKYYIDKKDVTFIYGKRYYKIKLSRDDSGYKTGQVCALVSEGMENGLILESVSFYPDTYHIEKIPIIRGHRGGKLRAEHCAFRGGVVIDVGFESSIEITNSNIYGDVMIATHPRVESKIHKSYISGDGLQIINSDVSHYEMNGFEIHLQSASLTGNKDLSNVIQGKNILLSSSVAEPNIITNTNFEGDNIRIDGPSTVENATILDGTLIENSEVIGRGGDVRLNKATIIEGSRVVSFSDQTNIEDSSIKNSDITIGGNLEQSKIKTKDRTFEIVKSVVSECTGDMPKRIEESICEKCNNICQYKSVKQCEMFGEEFETPLLGGFLKRFGIDKPQYYADEVFKKYVAPNQFYDIDKYHKAMEKPDDAVDQSEIKEQSDDVLFSQ